MRLSAHCFKSALPAVSVFLLATMALIPTGVAPGQERSPPDEWEQYRPEFSLEPVPKLDAAQRKLTDAEVAEIRQCINRLAALESPDYGISATMTGHAFLPLPGHEQGQAMLLTDHRMKPSADLRRLVELGPAALPFLLEALDDQTPTQITLSHESVIGAMWFARELSGNPLNVREGKVLAETGNEPDFPPDDDLIESYTVNVGDVCFVAIGQIVGRPYSAVRYQPTACIVVNSPTHDPTLRERVRSMWVSEDSPEQALLQSLLLDFATRGVAKGDSLDSWGPGSDLQIGAAMRLLYYYPKAAAQLVADRLRGLEVMAPKEEGIDAWMQRELANGVRTEEFVKAVSWCPEPEVRQAVGDIFRRTDETDVLLAALPGITQEERDLVGQRLDHFLEAVPAEERGGYGDGYRLLVAMSERLGPDAAPAFERYLSGGSSQRGFSAARALREAQGEWPLRLLRRLLDDPRPVSGYTIPGPPDDSGEPEYLRIRVCDAAAEVLATQRPDLTFTMRGSYAELNEQLVALRKQLDSELD